MIYKWPAVREILGSPSGSSPNDGQQQDSGASSSCQRDAEKRLMAALEAFDLVHEISSVESLNSLIEIFSKVNEYASKDLLPKSIMSHTDFLSHQVTDSLQSEWISEASELSQILSSPLMKLLYLCCDEITNSSDFIHYNYLRPASAASGFSASQTAYHVYEDINEPYYDSLHYSNFYSDHQNPKSVHFRASSSRCLTSDVNSHTTTYSTAIRYIMKIVTLVKGQEPLGVTIKISDDGSVMISRVIHGGSAHRSGLISTGDTILEANNQQLRGRSEKEVIHILERESRSDSITFKLMIPDPLCRHMISSEAMRDQMPVIFVRTFFDYNPLLDANHPCPAAGLLFKKGEILEIVNQNEDDDWWQARYEDDDYGGRAGIIPSAKYQEKRLSDFCDIQKKKELYRQKMHIVPGVKGPFKKYVWSKKVKKIMYKIHETQEFELNDVPTYEEVIHLFPTPGFCRPIVLIGAPKIGRNKLIKRLCQTDPALFKKPLTHTTRPYVHDFWSCRNGYYDPSSPFLSSQQKSQQFLHTTKDWMMNEFKNGSFIEFGELNSHLYGIHRETVRSIIAAGCVCILSLGPQGLKNVRNPIFKPFVIYLKPPLDLKVFKESRKTYNRVGNSLLKRKYSANLHKQLSDEELMRIMIESNQLEYIYGHYFDVIILMDDFESAFSNLVQTIKSVQLIPQWAPASWL